MDWWRCCAAVKFSMLSSPRRLNKVQRGKRSTGFRRSFCKRFRRIASCCESLTDITCTFLPFNLRTCEQTLRREGNSGDFFKNADRRLFRRHESIERNDKCLFQCRLSGENRMRDCVRKNKPGGSRRKSLLILR